MSQTRPHARAVVEHRRAFTLIEALLVLVLVVLLVALLMPALRQARESARLSVCASNLRQIAMGVNLYATDHRGHAPHGLGYSTYGISSERFSSHFGLLHDRYVTASPNARAGIWICPSERDEAWLAESPWAWSSAQDRARWRGTYWQAYRAQHPEDRQRIVNPANHFGGSPLPLYQQTPLATGGSAFAWPPLRPADRRGSYSFAFDGIVTYRGSVPNPGRTSRHDLGYQAAYYDGSAKLFGSTDAQRIDLHAVTASTYYNASYYAARYTFDPARNLPY
jgi:type II secretory pathway pseudopilin PulG